MRYSSLFNTLYDEQNPVGNLGRGAHYSVLSAVQWVDKHKKLLPVPGIQKFAVIWDEDHDERVMSIIERAYMRGIFAPVLYVGEKKAYVTVVVDEEFFEIIQSDWVSYIMAWEDICKNVEGDHWHVDIVPSSKSNDSTIGIIADTNDKVYTYLKNINNLWKLGVGSYIHLSKDQLPPPPLPIFPDPVQLV